MSNKIKLSIGFLISVATLFGFLVVPTSALAATCNSGTATLHGTVITGTPPTHARFEYGTDYNTVVNGGGTTTTVQVFNTEGTFPIDQFISGLSENTTYYDRLVVTNNYGTIATSIDIFTTPQCTQTPTIINGGWSNWSAQDYTCGYSGVQTRSCNNPTPANGGAYCSGPSTQSYKNPDCYVAPTIINGGWSDWTSQNTQCGYSGTQTRNCNNPTPANGGSYCYGSSSQSYTNAACYVPSPTVTLSANPSSITSNQNSTLTWNSTNATSCSSYWTGSTATNGSGVVVPTSTTTYSITCYGTNGQQTTAQATVNVTQVQAPTIINGGWSDWTSQNTQCGYSGTQTRSCNNPTPANGGSYCYGSSSQSYTNSACYVPYVPPIITPIIITNTNTNINANNNNPAPTYSTPIQPTPVNGGWSNWSTQDYTCGISGVQTRTCTNPSPANGGSYCYGLSSQSYTNAACYVTLPTVTLTANPSSITSNQNSTLTWNSTNATSCSSYWTGSTATNGSGVVVPTSTTIYNITCTNSAGQQANASATVYVNQVQAPTVTLSANPSTIQYGGNSTLTWNSTNATSCSSYWTGSTATNGSGVVVPTSTTIYNITCTNSAGQQANASATVYVNQVQQTCQDPSAINYRGTLPCTYNNYVVQTCQDPSAINYRGTLPCTYNNYVVQTCQDPSAINYMGTLPCSYNNIVVNNQPTVTVYSDQTNVAYNGSATVRWITTNATYCNASGGSVGWAGAKSIGPGSFYTGSLTSSKTYTLTCSNNFGSANDSVTITVRAQAVATVASPKPAPTSLVLITSSVDRNQPIVPTIDNTRPRPGDEINYTVSYQNIGNASITGLSLRIDLPYEVDYISSNPNNPIRSGNTLIFNLGTLKANGQGTVTVRTLVRDNIPAGTNLNFPATLGYIDPSGFSQSVNANVSAQVWSAPINETVAPAATTLFGANVFGAGFLPINLFGWLLLLILVLVLVFLAKYLLDQSFRKKTTIVTDQPSGKKTTTTTLQ